MSDISEIYRVRQRAIEYAIKHNNNSKAAVKYKTSRQQLKRWRDWTVPSYLSLQRFICCRDVLYFTAAFELLCFIAYSIAR